MEQRGNFFLAKTSITSGRILCNDVQTVEKGVTHGEHETSL